MLTIRSPVDGRLEIIEEPDNSSTIILLAKDPRLIVVIRNVTDAITRQIELKENEFVDPDALTRIKAGDILGKMGPFSQKLHMQVAYQAHSKTKPHTGWQLIDPRLILPALP